MLPAAATAMAADVSPQVKLWPAATRTRFDRDAGRLVSTVNMVAGNESGYSVVSPVHAVVQIASNLLPRVAMPGAWGGPLDPTYHTYYADLSGSLTDGKFQAGGLLGFPLVFDRHKYLRFSYGVAPRGALYREQPPVVRVEPAALSVDEGGSARIRVTATDPEDAVLTFGVEPPLSNATFEAAAKVNPEGTYTFAPAVGQRGVYFVAFTARDPLGMTDSETVQITVRRGNRAPTLAPVEPATVNEGELLTVNLEAADPDGDPVSLVALTPLPSNAVLVADARRLYFAPDFTQAGEYSLALQATDGALSSPTQLVHVTVADVAVADAGDTNQMTLVVDEAESPTLQSKLRVTGRVNVGTNVYAAGQPVRSALITGLNPSGGRQGERLEVLLSGPDSGPYTTHFAAGASRADFGAGIVVRDVAVHAPTSLTARIEIAADAAPGPRAVTVATEPEVAVGVLAFLVEPGYATLSGRLIDSASSNAIAGATVSLEGTTLSTVTGADGSYRLDGIPPGDHVLIINPPDHELIRMAVNGDSKQTLDMGDVRSRATVFDPDAPAAVSLFSVLGRGLGETRGGVNIAEMKRAITDAILLAGGSQAGVLDESGNQLNPNVVSNGLLTLTHEGVRLIAERTDRGETVALAELLLPLSQCFEWSKGHPMSSRDWLEAMQAYVNAAWADPANPENQLPILIFNRGSRLSPDPPVLSPEMRLSPTQAYLLAGSLWAYLTEEAASAPPPAPGRRGIPGGGAYFTGYWRNCFNAKQNFMERTFNTAMTGYLVVTMTASLMMMSGSLAGAILAMPVLGAAATHLVTTFGTMKFATIVPAPPVLTSAEFVVNTDATYRVDVQFQRSKSDLKTDKYSYALYRFRTPDEPRVLTAFTTMAHTNKSDNLTLTDPKPLAGTWFYAVTMAVTFSTTDSLTVDELVATLPWWDDPFMGRTDAAHNFMRSKQKMMSDYSNPGIVYVGMVPPAVQVDGLAVDPKKGDAYLSDISGDPRGYDPTNWPQIIKIADDGAFAHTNFAYPGFKDVQRGLAIDTQGHVYCENKASEDLYGGRLFRFAQPDGARDFVGSVNYFSRELMYARPASVGPLCIGPGAVPESSPEDLYLVENIGQHVLRAPVQAPYDPYRRVAQLFADIPVAGHAVDLEVTPRGNAYVLLSGATPKMSFPRVTYPNQAHGGPDPICFQTGFFSMSETDFALPGDGKLLAEMTRTYTAQNLAETNGPLGVGWDYNYNLRLEMRTDEVSRLHVVLGSGFGTQFHFEQNPDGSYATTEGWRLNLSGPSNAYVVTDGLGNRLTFDKEGKLERISDQRRPEGVLTLHYATVTVGSNKVYALDQVRNGAGRTVLGFGHDDKGRVTSVHDPDGTHCWYQYDATGNLAVVTNSAGQFMKFGYDAQHRMTSVTYPNGAVMLRNTYNDRNQVTNQFYRGGTATLEYVDGVTTVTDRDGHPTAYYYNSYGNLTRVVDPLGQATEYIWNADRELVKVIYPDGTSQSYGYDAAGNATAVTNALGDVWRFAFNTNRQVTRVEGPLGRSRSFEYDGAGRLAAVSNAEGYVTRADYDGEGKLTRITNPRREALGFRYNGTGELTGFESPSTGLQHDFDDPAEIAEAVTFNAMGLVTEIKGAYGTTRCAYDALGNVKEVTDDLGHTVKYDYDTQGRMMTTTFPDGSAVRYDRNGEGLIRGYTAPNGKTYRSQRDAAGRVVGNTDLLGKTYGYGYDEVGNLVARTNAAGQVTRFEHDALRRVTKVTGHDGTTERFEYDALGNLTRAYCADGSCDIRLEYDRLNRLTARRVLAPYRRSLTYTYDGMGKRLTVTDSDGIVTAYTYDLYNRPTSVSNRLTGEFRFVYQPQFELAPVRNLEFIFYPNGC